MGEKVTISGKLGDDAKMYQEKLVRKSLRKVEGKMRSIADQYEKIVVWSDEDDCYIGTCPEFFFGGVHGDDPIKVFEE